MNKTNKVTASVALALSLAACSSDEQKSDPACCTTDAFNNVVVGTSEQKVAGDYPLRFFKDGSKTVSFLGLSDQNNETIDAQYLADHLKGRRLMLYFGFPDCTDYCPPSTSGMMQLADRHTEIVPIVIANQPGYSHQDMAEWAERIDPINSRGVIALTGSPQKLAAIFQTLNVNVQNGTIHLPTVEFIDETGKWRASAAAIKEGIVQKYDPDHIELESAYQEAYSSQNNLEPYVPR